MNEITLSIQKVQEAGVVDDSGNRRAWTEKEMSLKAAAQPRFQMLISPFEKAVIQQIAKDIAEKNGGKPSDSRTGRVLLRTALGLDN